MKQPLPPSPLLPDTPQQSPTRRAAATKPEFRNYALQPTSPPHAPLGSPQQKTKSPRRRRTFMREDSDHFTVSNRQDDNGAVQKSSIIVFQSGPSVHQMIESGEVCFFDDMSPYVPTHLSHFCFLSLNDDNINDRPQSYDGTSCIADRSIWIHKTHAELQWTTAGRPTNPTERRQHTHKMGFCQLLHFFLGAVQETQLMKAAELFRALHIAQCSSHSTDSSCDVCSHKLPPVKTLSGGRQGSLLYQAVKRHNNDLLNVELFESSGGGSGGDGEESNDGGAFAVEIKVRLLPSSEGGGGVTSRLKETVTGVRDECRPPQCSSFTRDSTSLSEACTGRTRSSSQGYILNNAKQHKYARSHFYSLEAEDVRWFLFDKALFSADHFGECTAENAPKDDNQFDHNFFGKLIEGLVYCSESDAINVDFIEMYKLEKHHTSAISSRERAIIDRVFDDSKMEVAMRESVSRMVQLQQSRMQRNGNAVDSETLTSIYSSFINDQDIKTNDSNTAKNRLEDDEEDGLFGIQMLTLRERDNVHSTYVMSFNAEILKQVATTEKEKAVRMEIFMGKFALVQSTDRTTPEDHHLYDSAPLPSYTSFSTRGSKFLYGFVTRSSPVCVAVVRESLMIPPNKRSLAAQGNVLNMLLRTRGLSERLTACSIQSLLHLARICSFIHFPHGGAKLAKIGEYINCCFIVLTGSLRVVKGSLKPRSNNVSQGREDPGESNKNMKHMRQSSTRRMSKGSLVGAEVFKGKGHWGADITTASADTSVCLIPFQFLAKHVGIVNKRSQHFMKCFWLSNKLWGYARGATEEKRRGVPRWRHDISQRPGLADSSGEFTSIPYVGARAGDDDGDGDGGEGGVSSFVSIEADMSTVGSENNQHSRRNRTSSALDPPTHQATLHDFLTRRSYIRRFRPGEIIYQQGTESHLLHVIMLGECAHIRKLSAKRPLESECSEARRGRAGEMGENGFDLTEPPTSGNDTVDIEIDLGQDLLPGHFAMEVTDQHLTTCPTKTKGDDSADSAKTCNSGKEKATATTAQTFSFSLLSAASEDEIDQCGGMRYQKREGVFRKTFLTSLADHDFSLTTAAFGVHRNSLVAKTYAEVCVLPLCDVNECPPVLFRELIQVFRQSYTRPMISDEALVASYKDSLELKIFEILEKIKLFEDMAKRNIYAVVHPGKNEVGNAEATKCSSNQCRLKADLEAVRHDYLSLEKYLLWAK